jgi:hypothetical protein
MDEWLNFHEKNFMKFKMDFFLSNIEYSPQFYFIHEIPSMQLYD